MPRSLKLALAVTDVLFLAYWAMSGLAQLKVIHIPHEWMYAHYDQALVVAWNWSFLPLDLSFSVLGLSAVAAARRGDPSWRPLALLSLAFTMAAGGMAIAYWDPSWGIRPGLVPAQPCAGPLAAVLRSGTCAADRVTGPRAVTRTRAVPCLEAPSGHSVSRC